MKTNTRAVTPVVSIILMVAVAIILVSVVATYSLGLTDELPKTSPAAVLEMSDASEDFDSGYGERPNFVDITHDNGNPLSANDISIKIYKSSDQLLLAEWTGDKWKPIGASYEPQFQSASDSTSAFYSDPLSPGDSITIQWYQPTQGSSQWSETDQEYIIQINHIPSGQLVSKQTVDVS
ncbi:type IV pilin [Halobellus sp. Atlit-38R]|uniref:type IV pilin n=1 Tax=Halobellus sp. Atlit-38R TaxID=2282131 RepID=UPI000EF241AB|nr:type IV pilin N-terminal domain-containing protein [Halobellus sp. Atlit-38R]RLM83860.1 type IV pilin [Halobellus sp. Atlit-38R]